MKSDEPLGKFPFLFLVYDYRPQDWGQSARARGVIASLIRNRSPHSVDFVATSPLKGRGIVFADHERYLGAHFVRPECYPPASWIFSAPQDIVPEMAK